jgi:hypothetical protein
MFPLMLTGTFHFQLNGYREETLPGDTKPGSEGESDCLLPSSAEI